MMLPECFASNRTPRLISHTLDDDNLEFVSQRLCTKSENPPTAQLVDGSDPTYKIVLREILRLPRQKIELLCNDHSRQARRRFKFAIGVGIV